VTGTFTLVLFAGKVTLEGTVATLVSLELTLNVRPPAGAGVVRVNVRLLVVAVPVITRLDGWKLSPDVTDTGWLADPMPDAEAVMVDTPKLTPVTLGVVAVVVMPCEKKIADGDIVTFEVSLLVRLTKAPPGGAGAARVTGKFAVSPGASVTLAGKIMGEEPVTVTLAFAGLKPAALAVIVVEPDATPVTGTFAVVALWLTVTVAGTVATPGLLELKLTV
jgi:hypothetical protein